MAETVPFSIAPQPSKLWKGVFAVAGIMTTLVTYGVLQVRISLTFLQLFESISIVMAKSLNLAPFRAGKDHESPVRGRQGVFQVLVVSRLLQSHYDVGDLRRSLVGEQEGFGSRCSGLQVLPCIGF